MPDGYWTSAIILTYSAPKLRPMGRVLAALLLTLSLGVATAQAQPQEPAASLSSTAERIYAETRPKLLQIRTLVAAAGRQSSIGSGFLVSADGLAITNYHVVSQYALEPKTYRLEYASADGKSGDLKLLAIDLANDLAIVRTDRRDQPYLQFDPRGVSGELPNGERLYSMGNPLDLGFTIVEGTYNGLVERSYTDRIHFSGAVNPGMSGGPTVTVDGRIAGINVSKQIGGELVSFLVPAGHAATLLKRVEADQEPPPDDFRAEIGRQLSAWQARLYKSINEMGFRPATFGPYQAAESGAPWFTCWAQTNAGQLPKPRAAINSTNCNSDTRLFVANDFSTGLIHLDHSYVQSVDLNQFQFSAFLSSKSQAIWPGGWAQKWQTQPRCQEGFVAAKPESEHPPLRVVWCARAYRQFEGLYDVSVLIVTQDSGTRALVSRLGLQAVSYDNAIALSRRFLEAVRWTK